MPYRKKAAGWLACVSGLWGQPHYCVCCYQTCENGCEVVWACEVVGVVWAGGGLHPTKSRTSPSPWSCVQHGLPYQVTGYALSCSQGMSGWAIELWAGWYGLSGRGYEWVRKGGVQGSGAAQGPYSPGCYYLLAFGPNYQICNHNMELYIFSCISFLRLKFHKGAQHLPWHTQ